MNRGQGAAVVPIDAVARLEKSFLDARRGFSHAQSIEFTQALSDIAVRIERAAEVLAQVIRLSKPEAPLKTVRLTPRELEILGYLADGLTNNAIAAKCWVSENTVKFHVKNVFRKLDIRDRGQATMIARSMQQATK